MPTHSRCGLEDQLRGKQLFIYLCHEVHVTIGICLLVLLSLCLLAALRENYWLDLHQNFTRAVPWDKEEMINVRCFWIMTIQKLGTAFNSTIVATKWPRPFVYNGLQLSQCHYSSVELFIDDDVTLQIETVRFNIAHFSTIWPWHK